MGSKYLTIRFQVWPRTGGKPFFAFQWRHVYNGFVLILARCISDSVISSWIRNISAFKMKVQVFKMTIIPICLESSLEGLLHISNNKTMNSNPNLVITIITNRSSSLWNVGNSIQLAWRPRKIPFAVALEAVFVICKYHQHFYGVILFGN